MIRLNDFHAPPPPARTPGLSDTIEAIESYDRFVEDQVRLARTDGRLAEELRQRWQTIRDGVGETTTPTGLRIPRLALPTVDEPGEIARYLYGEGLPGEFPFLNGAYRELYLREEPDQSIGRNGNGHSQTEEPTRLFAGFGLAEDTNARFNYLVGHQRSVRLSTAFDGPTLYGIDSDTDGALGKIGEGGVAIDTIEDMLRLYDGFDLGDRNTSVSMTINGPAPIILAMYVAAARRRFGPEVIVNLRGTVQADILKEVQAQNEMLFPIEPALRFLTDMVEYTTAHMPRWYPISISGYHIAEAGATPVQQAAYTLSNGLAYVQLFRERGMDVNVFGPRLSFFLDCGLDIEYLVLARVCRKIWAIAMRDVFGAGPAAQRLKLHTQTSGRSLIAREFRNNLTRTAIELLMAYANGTNSCHSNSADEPFTTPSEDYVRLAANAQSILLEESGLFKHMMNVLGSSPGMKALEATVQAGILDEFRQIDSLGGVLAAVENRYQRSQIQLSAHHYEQQISSGERPIVGLNVYRDSGGRGSVRAVSRNTKAAPRELTCTRGTRMSPLAHAMADKNVCPTVPPSPAVMRTPVKKQREQIARVREFKRRHAKDAPAALEKLDHVVRDGGNVFAELIETVERCSLGQITVQLQETVGRYRPMV